MININNRLALCADFVTGNGTAVDVGTDHAYLASYLVLNRICNSVIACDINSGPLLTARQTLLKYKIDDKVMLLQSDGLQDVPEYNVTDVIIAGMGGELISQIIGQTDWIRNGINLVLQPMTKIAFLRKWLYKNGFEIKHEQAVEADNQIYTVINAVYCAEFQDIDDFFAETGKLDFKNDTSKKFLIRQVKRLEVTAEEMQKSECQKENAKKILLLSQKISAKVID